MKGSIHLRGLNCLSSRGPLGVKLLLANLSWHRWTCSGKSASAMFNLLLLQLKLLFVFLRGLIFNFSAVWNFWVLSMTKNVDIFNADTNLHANFMFFFMCIRMLHFEEWISLNRDPCFLEIKKVSDLELGL